MRILQILQQSERRLIDILREQERVEKNWEDFMQWIKNDKMDKIGYRKGQDKGVEVQKKLKLSKVENRIESSQN